MLITFAPHNTITRASLNIRCGGGCKAKCGEGMFLANIRIVLVFLVQLSVEAVITYSLLPVKCRINDHPDLRVIVSLTGQDVGVEGDRGKARTDSRSISRERG